MFNTKFRDRGSVRWVFLHFQASILYLYLPPSSPFSSNTSSTDLSNGRRIVIAVTQHDHYYTGKQDEELSAETTQDHVHEGLQQLGFTVPREQIVIVSG